MMSSDVNRRRLPGNGLIGVRLPGMEHPLLGPMPAGVCPAHSRTASYLLERRPGTAVEQEIAGPEAKLVLPIKFRTTRLAARKGQGPHRFD